MAFFHADVGEQVAVLPTDGLAAPGCVWQLRRAMYGTRAAPRCWRRFVREIILGAGFAVAGGTPNLFRHAGWDVTTVVHGDDFLAEGTDTNLDRLDAALKGSMEINIFSPASGPDTGSVSDVFWEGRCASCMGTGSSMRPVASTPGIS